MSLPVIPWGGGKITVPGLYSGVPIDVYHGDACSGPSVSSSGLRTIFYESPAHYYVDSYLNPKREPKKPSEAFVFGRGAHFLLLGERHFHQHFSIRPETYPPQDKLWSGNANWCKAWMKAAEDRKHTVLTQGDIKAIRGMASAMAEEPLIQAGVLNGLIEHSFFWKDKASGVWIKWRPDAIPTSDLSFADLKTTASVRDEDLERSIGAYGYHAQGGLGAVACREVLGREMDSFVLVFVEKAPPHCVRVKQLRDGDIELGVKQNEVALRLFARCLETDMWPGPGGLQSDAEFAGLHGKTAERVLFRFDEIERQLSQ